MALTMTSRNRWLGLLFAAVVTCSSGVLASTSSCETDFIADGDCDMANNNAECSFDGGDCCECTCIVPDGEIGLCSGNFACIDPAASCVNDDDITVDMIENCGSPRGIGDGFCHPDNNNAACQYDGGDCCECTCISGGDSSDDYAYYASCNTGFACIDPDAPCVDDDDITVDMVENCGSVKSIGNGYCNPDNNNAFCNYDGGDCCECTCTDPEDTDDYYDGCTSGFACIDPKAPCVDDDDITVDMVQNCGYVQGIGNGRCDNENNNEYCSFDGGDCCKCTCVPSQDDDYYGCTDGFACIDPAASCVNDDDITVDHTGACNTYAMSDGYCDESQNTPECNYDGGDCCSCTCEGGITDDFIYGCTHFACVDPSAPCVDDDDITADMLENCFSVLNIGNGYCDPDMNKPECNFDGGDCCQCTCQADDDYDFACGGWGYYSFDCVDPDAPCFGVPPEVHHQQMKIQENGHTFKVTRFEDGRKAPYRIYFWNDGLTGSSYRFDGNGDLVYFKAGSEIYHDIVVLDGVHGLGVEFSRKVESGGGRGGEKHDDNDKSDDAGPLQDSLKEFNCYQCWEALSLVCGSGYGHVGGLKKFCGAVDKSALGRDGADSVEILCDNSVDTCANAISQCNSACGVDDDYLFTDDDHDFTSTTWLLSDDTVDDDHSGYMYVEAGTKTTVSVAATAFDERPGGSNGCGMHGCAPALAYDGITHDVESRWSCSEDIVPDGGQCEIEFTFKDAQNIEDIQVDFWKGDERTRYLKVTINGHKVDEFESQPGSISTLLGIHKHGVHTVTLESLGLHKHEWISLLEVHFYVEP